MLARAGVASRREVERLIAAGRVALNGVVLTTPAVKVDPGDILTVDGAVVGDAEPARLFRYHKPVGLMTSHNDPQGRPTVFEALPEGLPRLISVGRLDLNSEGLLLLTNDGGLARALEQPTTGIIRRYRARAHGRITQDKLDKLKDGIEVEGVRYGAIEAKLDKAKDGPSGSNVWITLTLAEGKNREIRRVLEHLGLQVNRLIRLSYGPFALGTLEVGQVEEVGPRVIREQLAEHIPAENMPKGDRPQFTGVGNSTGKLRRQATPPGPNKAARSRAGTGEPRVKTEYKTGWATPKIDPPRGPSRSKRNAPRPERFSPGDSPRSDGPRTDRPRTPRPEGLRSDAPRTEGTRPERPRPAGAGFKGPRPEGFRSDGPRTDRPRAPRPDGPRSDGPRSDGPRPERPKFRSDGPRSDKPRGPRPDGPRSDGPRPERPRSDGPRSDGPRPPRKDGPRPPPRSDGPRSDGPRSEGPRSEAPRPPRKDGPPRAGGPKRAGPGGGKPFAGGPRSGPRGPKR